MNWNGARMELYSAFAKILKVFILFIASVKGWGYYGPLPDEYCKQYCYVSCGKIKSRSLREIAICEHANRECECINYISIRHPAIVALIAIAVAAVFTAFAMCCRLSYVNQIREEQVQLGLVQPPRNYPQVRVATPTAQQHPRPRFQDVDDPPPSYSSLFGHNAQDRPVSVASTRILVSSAKTRF